MKPRIADVAACALVIGLAPVCQAFAAEDQTAQGKSQATAHAENITVIGRKPVSPLQNKNEALDRARDKILLPKIGATSFSMDHKAIETLPQGEDTPIDKVLLQAPGVSADTAISNPDFHVRNEYANVQYRIDGIQLPDGVSALGPVLETNFIGNLDLLDGALPAQYGLRTAGVVDLTTKNGFTDGGLLSVNGGSQATFSPSVQYGGHSGQTDYFGSFRYLQSDEGLESATPGPNAVHDQTTQEKFFGYGSTLLNDTSRLTYMAGGFAGRFQIPNVIGEAPLGDYGPSTLSSANINENERDNFFFGLVALQTHTDTIDTQFSVFSRYATANFVPDLAYDLAFNDVAAHVTRESLLDGAQFDSALRLNDAHTLRAGLIVAAEQTRVGDLATVLPLNAAGNPLPTPVAIDQKTSKLGWTAGAYVQDEWRINPALTLNTGLRFDQISQFVSANQFSPRLALVYKPFQATSLHIGVSRYFTPPMQAQAAPANLSVFANTTQQQAIQQDSPVRPERATYIDVGLDQQVLSSINLGLDAYYKRSHNTLDDGQFGQAVVLTQFNYAEGFSQGVEFKASYAASGWRAYGNFSAEVTKGKDVISNQYLIGDPVELAYLAGHYTYASDAQTLSASFGASYSWRGLVVSVDGIYGSGLRTGFANEQHTPGYTQWNAAITRRFDVWSERTPLTLRLSVVNLFDASYILRSGSGIGEFAPQYGPRREFFVSLSQAF
jgi:outer membrane receptor protein involved in Fe transport